MNDMHFLTQSFIDAMKKNKMSEFYVDSRVGGKPVSSGYSMGKVGKREFTKAIKAKTSTTSRNPFTNTLHTLT